MFDVKSSWRESQHDFWVAESVKDQSIEDCYEIDAEISSGPFGTLVECKPKGTNKSVCVKIIPKNKSRRVYLKEASHLLKLKHSNLVRVREIFENVDSLYIVSDYMTGNEVLERVSKRHSFTERNAAKILIQILEGLKYLHEEELVHGNLKPQNFMYESYDEDSRIKIADVSLYSILDREVIKHSVATSAEFCAPEVLKLEHCDSVSDMWAFGAFAYTLLCGEEPFKSENDEELYRKIFKGLYTTDSVNYKNLSTNAKDFIMKFLAVDPRKRWSAAQTLSNNWLLGRATKNENLTACLDSLKVIVNKHRTQSFLNKQLLKSRGGKMSLVQKYLPKDCWLWLQKTTKNGTSLVECVKSAVENKDSQVGLYAPDPDCYDTFPEIFWPVISDYHKVDVNALKARNDFGNPAEIKEFEQKYAEHIVSIRMSIARTLHGFPMGPKLDRETRERIKDEMTGAFRYLQDDLYGDYVDLTELSNEERDNLIKSNYLFSNADDSYLKSAGTYSDWPLNRGFFISRNKSFVVWINEEDHMRVISLQKGSNVQKAYARLVKGVQILEQHLKFVYHEKFGYLTFSPTNIGTTLSVSFQLKLPRLAASGRLDDVCQALNLEARPQTNDNNNSSDALFSIVNLTKLNKTEFELLTSIHGSIRKLLDEELSIKK